LNEIDEPAQGENDGGAACVLKPFQVDPEQTRQEILEENDPNFNPGDKGQTGQG
jgi:hypothetical protein